ncbi:MAG: glycosyltransferase family 4 protein, partial [Candidatus Aegiribacteria sp.]|nr:glycosyltransferase family 4 protein [Candidatus Aegiribacteria sp.]
MNFAERDMKGGPGRILMPGYIDTTDPERLGRLTGGIFYDFMIGERFRTSGWEVEYFDLETLPRYAKMLKLPSAGIISHRCGNAFNLLVTTLGCSTLTLGLQRMANRHGRFTVLICHHFRGHLERTPLRRFLYRWTEKRIVREADFIIAISGSTVRKLEELGRSGQDVLLARPGLNVRLADEPKFREDPHRLLLVGNIEERKGILEAVKALAYSNLENVELCIVGERNFDQGYLRKVEECIGELGLEERVHITGRLSDADLATEYNRADVFLLPSYWEGYG